MCAVTTAIYPLINLIMEMKPAVVELVYVVPVVAEEDVVIVEVVVVVLVVNQGMEKVVLYC